MRPSFNSIYNKAVAETQTQFPVLQQHFIGWFIKSDEAVLIPHELLSWIFGCAKSTRFMYAAYISHRSFTRIHLVFAWSFESRIRNGNKNTCSVWITNYSITEKNKEASQWLVTRSGKKYTKVLNIGTAGWTKASTGYTFKNSDKYSTQLVKFLEQGRNLKNFTIKLNFGIMTCCY
jgi:lycopene beta-cyclase